MICSPSAETPEGTFYTPVKYRWHEMIGNCYAQYCTRITGQVLFHSVWYYTNGDKSTMSVSAYNVLGQKASHGCVRLLCKDAKWIYDNCALKTKVVIFNGTKKDDPLGRPGFTPINSGKFMSWDPTDPDKKNPYRKLQPKITVKRKNIEYKSKIKVKDLVTIKDSADNVITAKDKKVKIKTKGKVNTKKLGKYKVTYTVKDSLGKKIKKAFTFKVVDTKKPKIKGAKSKKSIAMNTTQNVLAKVTANAVSGKNLTSKITVRVKNKKTGKYLKVTKGKVKFTKAGVYSVIYKVVGANKKKITKTIKYRVIDMRVKFNVKSAVTINQNSKFDPYSCVTSLKNYKGSVLNIKSNVIVSGNVDVTKAGKYTIKYTATWNKLAYTAVTKTVTVTVTVKEAEIPTTKPEETTVPEITTAPEITTSTTDDANQDEGWTENY